MTADFDLVKYLADGLTDDPDVFKETKHSVKPKLKRKRTPGILSESVETATHLCRNSVYRRGAVMHCGRVCAQIYCESCADALQDRGNMLSGLYEDKKSPSNELDTLEVEDSFEVQDGFDEDKKEPTDKQKRKSSLQDGPDGEKGSKKSPYLK